MIYSKGSYGYIAAKDMRTAKSCLSTECWDQAVISSQQAIEKLLKEYMHHIPHIDDFESLLKSHKPVRIASALGIPELTQYMDVLRELGDSYFESRHPGVDYTEHSCESATRLVIISCKIMDIIDMLIDEKQNKQSKTDIRRMSFQ